MHNMSFYTDLAERAAWTALQAFAAVVIYQGEFTWLSLKLGAIAAGLAVLKAIVAGQFGNKDTAALP